MRQSDIANYANMFGGDVELDPQERYSLPAVLRDKAKLDGERITMLFKDDVISLYTEKQYADLLARLEPVIADHHSWAASRGFSL